MGNGVFGALQTARAGSKQLRSRELLACFDSLNLGSARLASALGAEQRQHYRRLGDYFIGIDATHNITIYEGLQLFTIIARDRWGHGE